MIFQSSVRKELSQSFVITLMVLMTVVMSNMLIQTLGQATRGVINNTDVLLVMCLTLFGYSGTLLTLSLFIATISTLSRMFRDSEMVIWFSSGQGLGSLAVPILHFAWPILLCILVSAGIIWPWSHQHIRDLEAKFESRNDVERVAPGKFLEFSGGTGVFFIDKDSPSQKAGRNVFVSRTEGDWNTIISAKQGNVELINNERFLSMRDGQQFSTNASTHESRLIQFKNYQLLISENENIPLRETPSYAINSINLLINPTLSGQAELFWRLGQVLCAFNLLILAIALSTVNPRAASSYHVFQALLVFIIYYNSINLVQRWIAEGRLPFFLSLLLVHGVTFLMGIIWIKSKEFNWSIRTWLALPSSETK